MELEAVLVNTFPRFCERNRTMRRNRNPLVLSKILQRSRNLFKIFGERNTNGKGCEECFYLSHFALLMSPGFITRSRLDPRHGTCASPNIRKFLKFDIVTGLGSSDEAGGLFRNR